MVVARPVAADIDQFLPGLPDLQLEPDEERPGCEVPDEGRRLGGRDEAHHPLVQAARDLLLPDLARREVEDGHGVDDRVVPLGELLPEGRDEILDGIDREDPQVVHAAPADGGEAAAPAVDERDVGAGPERGLGDERAEAARGLVGEEADRVERRPRRAGGDQDPAAAEAHAAHSASAAAISSRT